MQSAINVDQIKPRLPQKRRYLRHTIEAAIAILVVVSLTLGWLAVTKGHSTQGTGPTLFTYTSQPGVYTEMLNWTPDGKDLTFRTFTTDAKQYDYHYLVWDTTSGQARQTLTLSIPYPTPKGPEGLLINSPDGHYALLTTHSANGQIWTVKLANILTGQVTPIYQGMYQGQDASGLPASAFSADSKYAAFIGADARIHIWNIAAGKVIQTTDPLANVGTTGAQYLVWSTDGKRLITETTLPWGKVPFRRTLKVLSVETGHILVNFTENPDMLLFNTLLDPGGGVAGLSPDGTRILTHNQQPGTFVERDSSTLKVLQTFPVKDGTSYDVFWEANGTRLLLPGNPTAYIWNAETGKLVLTLALNNTSQTLLVPSGTRYVTREQPGNLLEIWDMVTGTRVRTIALTINPVIITWSTDGRYLDIRGDNSSGQVYNALTGQLLTNYAGDAALLSPDGQYVATLSTPTGPATNHSQHKLQILSVN